MSVATTIAPAARPMPAPRRFEPTTVDGDSQPEQTHRENGSDTSQCMKALARANEVRLARAALKREIAAGSCDITAVISESPWQAQSMSLTELLCSQRRWGRARSHKLLASIGLNEAKKLGTLTVRQRRVLVGALQAKLAGSV